MIAITPIDGESEDMVTSTPKQRRNSLKRSSHTLATVTELIYWPALSWTTPAVDLRTWCSPVVSSAQIMTGLSFSTPSHRASNRF
jgi:hypothetical protein